MSEDAAGSVAAHSAAQSHHYLMHFPSHPARASDPHYKDFDAYHRANHHSHIEFSLQNGVSLAALEKDYPGVSDPSQVGAWVESGANFRWLCAYHHRGAGGAHTAAHADWEASQYLFGLIAKEGPS